MVWQDAFASSGGPNFDAEDEREKRLAAQARAGADWALTALIARYQPTVIRYLTRLCGNQAQARRMAERIFQRMERRLHGPHGAEHLRLWLLRASTEAGLDTLRRPKGAPMPRLGAGGVAGLLADVSGKDAPAIVRKGVRRLRRMASEASQQLRPLIWSEDGAHDGVGANPQPGGESHLDDALDHLDPRDALRHRLVRVTLADMPYGDAQCLALHLVAGLNQAEVARALGITNSAARKRIVHGLALFSDRYSQAVQSLGLPPELGYGETASRAPLETLEPEPAAEPAPPPPVVVASQASEADLEVEGEDQLVALAAENAAESDLLSGVAYFSESGEIPAVQADTLASLDHAPTAANYHADEALATTPLEDDALEEEPFDEPVAAPVSGGVITRVAADAIVGPVVDALPVTPTAISAEDEGFGRVAPRSIPLAYELNSNTTLEAPGIMMRWLDDAGMISPLNVAAATEPDGAAEADEDTTPLGFEADAMMSGIHALPHESAPLGFEAVAIAEPHGGASARESESGALSYEAAPVAAPQPTQTPEGETAPITLEDEPPADSASGETAADDTPIAPRAGKGVVSRSLEALWDELPERTDL